MATGDNPTPQSFVDAVNNDSNRTFALPFNYVSQRRWVSFYGVSPDLCCIIWRKLDAHKSIIGAQYKHLMWALYFMKVYGNEENNSNFAGGVDEKTFRKWSHIFVEAISFLESSVVSIVLTLLLSFENLPPTHASHIIFQLMLFKDTLGCTDHR